MKNNRRLRFVGTSVILTALVAALTSCDLFQVILMIPSLSTAAGIINLNVDIDFFDKKWEKIYQFENQDNPGYYVFDCGDSKPNTDSMHFERFELFETKFTNYKNASIKNANNSKETTKEEIQNLPIQIEEQYDFSFDNSYLWCWYIEMPSSGNKRNGKEYMSLSDEEKKDNISNRNQVFVTYDSELNWVYAVTWYS